MTINGGKPMIEARDLRAGYGSLTVVHGVDIHVSAGEVVVLLGPNGAGKSTTLATMTGRQRPVSGEVRWEGHPTRMSHHQLARRGLAMVAEHSVFTTLTVADNLRLGQGPPERAVALFPELGRLLSRMGGLLSGGEQQMLGLARAMANDPKLLVVDELSLGLAPLIVRRLLDALRMAADQGAGVLLVEQYATRALEVADRAYLMRRGRIEFEGAASEVSQADLNRAYLA